MFVACASINKKISLNKRNGFGNIIVDPQNLFTYREVRLADADAKKQSGKKRNGKRTIDNSNSAKISIVTKSMRS